MRYVVLMVSGILDTGSKYSTFDNRAQSEARKEKDVLVDSCIAASFRYSLFDRFSNYNTLAVRDSGYVELVRCGNHVWRHGSAPCR